MDEITALLLTPKEGFLCPVGVACFTLVLPAPFGGNVGRTSALKRPLVRRNKGLVLKEWIQTTKLGSKIMVRGYDYL